jgi:hypothetical protein
VDGLMMPAEQAGDQVTSQGSWILSLTMKTMFHFSIGKKKSCSKYYIQAKPKKDEKQKWKNLPGLSATLLALDSSRNSADMVFSKLTLSLIPAWKPVGFGCA